MTVTIALAAATIVQAGPAEASTRPHHRHHGSSMHMVGARGYRHSHRVHRYASNIGQGRADAGAAGGYGGQVGRASFYAGGGRTASGGAVGSATCAHRSLPFGTKILVTNLANARQAVLTVNDRGPFVHGRLLDVSRGAAGLLGMLHAGVSQIRMQVLGGAG